MLTSKVHWLLVDLNSYFASCEQQENPNLRGKPIAVVPMLGVGTTSVLAASVQAKKFKIKTGTLVNEAKILCPKIEFVKAQHKVYIEYHHRILKALESCVPIHQVLSIDEMSCELTGSQKKITVALELAKKIKKTIQSQVGECLTTSIGIAENPLLAKIASDLKKPDGLVVIHAENREKVLSRLSVRAIPGVGFRTEKRLNENGIVTIKDLLTLSRQRMRALWGGVVGERYYDWLRGYEVELPSRKTKSLSHQHVLEPEYRNFVGVSLILKKLLIRACTRLRKNGYYTKRLTLLIKGLGEGQYLEFSQKVEETCDPLVLLKILDHFLQTFPEEFRPLRAGVVLSDLVLESEHQISLFSDLKRERLLRSMDIINQRYGRETVTLASLQDLEAASDSKIAFQRVPDRDEL